MKIFKYLVILFILSSFTISLFHLNEEYRWVKTGFLVSTNSSSSSSLSVASSSKSSIKYKYEYYSDNDINMVIFKDPIDIAYNPHVSNTVDEVSKEKNFNLAINGGYFNDLRIYAGLLIIDGEIKSHIGLADKQVNSIVIVNKSTNMIQFSNILDFDISLYKDKKDYIIFQTGPIIITNNILNESNINKSTNGLGKYYRSVLGITKSGKRFFAVSSSPYLLKDLGNILLNIKLLQDEVISVINLDGGSSTSIYSFENNDFNFGNSKVLPVIIGVKDHI